MNIYPKEGIFPLGVNNSFSRQGKNVASLVVEGCGVRSLERPQPVAAQGTGLRRKVDWRGIKHESGGWRPWLGVQPSGVLTRARAL